MYLVVIGDIVGSKKIESREELQRKLETVFKKINASGSGIISPYTITLGDEFQAVYKNANELFRDIWQILYEVHPVKIRFSLGLGEISTKINKKQSIGMDGSAFHNARAGMEELKTSDYILNITTDDQGEVSFMKPVLFLLSHNVSGWKLNMLQILYYLANDKSIKEIGSYTKISVKSVYKNIKRGALNVIIKISSEIAARINLMLKS